MLIPQCRSRWVYCQLDTLRRCFSGSIRCALNELPRTLDETYETISLGIDEGNWEYGLRLFQCLTVAHRPLQTPLLAEVLVVELDDGGIPKLNVDLCPRSVDEAVLSACSTLVAIIKPKTLFGILHLTGSGDSWLIQFPHHSVKEFLTSSRFTPESAHSPRTSYTSTLLQLDNSVNSVSNWVDFQGFPLAQYAVTDWINHVEVDGVASRIRIGMESLFEPELPHLTLWTYLRQSLY
jgi:hypothetical protein